MKLKKGQWVEIEDIVLEPGQRSSNLPEDTRNTPLLMWMRGFLNTDGAEIGERVEIRTLCDRRVQGVLVESKPRHNYDFGDTIIELIHIGEELKTLLKSTEEGVIENDR